MSGPCVILEVTDAEHWEPFRGCKKIREYRRPTVLHPSREVAEQEALRLAAENVHSRFVVLEAAVVAAAVKVPTHITLGGKVVAERFMPALMQVDEDEVPF